MKGLLGFLFPVFTFSKQDTDVAVDFDLYKYSQKVDISGSWVHNRKGATKAGLDCTVQKIALLFIINGRKSQVAGQNLKNPLQNSQKNLKFEI